MAELFDAIGRFNTILIDLDRDIWAYISMGYFGQKTVKGEVGSSTMPHKVNPIDFENSEGNLRAGQCPLRPPVRQTADLASAARPDRLHRAAQHGRRLRLQHDCLSSTTEGLGQTQAERAEPGRGPGQRLGSLAEPIQTVMRKAGIEKPYEKLKDLPAVRRSIVKRYASLLKASI